MNNKNSYNKLFNLTRNSDYYLTNNYEDNFQHDEWDNDYIMNVEDNIPVNDDYDNKYNVNNKYSFSNKKQINLNKAKK